MTNIPYGYEWQVGEPVVTYRVDVRGYRVDQQLTKIKRVMKRFIELENGMKWRHDGQPYPLPEGWCSREHLERATPELVEELTSESAAIELSNRLEKLYRQLLDTLRKGCGVSNIEAYREIVGVLDKWKDELNDG